VDSELDTLRLADSSWMFDSADRTCCPKCHKNRKYYCYDCLLSMNPSKTPTLKLPVDLDIVHFPTEKKSKSSALHAKVIAPTETNVYEFPQFPDYRTDLNDVVLLFPSKEAKFIHEVDLKRIKKIVVLDSQWQNTNKMLRDEKLQSMTTIKIDSYKTKFWRYQTKGDECLATLEAIYYFYKEYQIAKMGKYDGEFDNLLYFFALQHELIQQRYRTNQEIKFTKIDNYINYD